MEFNSRWIVLEHQHGRHFFVLGHQHGHRDVTWVASTPPLPSLPSFGENRPYSSCIFPLFQNESWCTTFHLEMSFQSCTFSVLKFKVIPNERLCTKTRYEAEGKGNSIRAYCQMTLSVFISLAAISLFSNHKTCFHRKRTSFLKMGNVITKLATKMKPLLSNLRS